MRRNCNLELCLLPPSSSSFFTDDQHHHHTSNLMAESSSETPPSRQQKQQPLTIFYDGNMSVCDVTELQARAILFHASKETEEKLMMKTPTPKGSSCMLEHSPTPWPTLTPTPTPTPTPCGSSKVVQMGSSPTAAGLSMKRSLQRFLQKRKNRVQATSPYHHH